MSDVFYEKLARIVEANLEKEPFGVNELVKEVGLSRSQIHRKLKSITGQSISQFIREIRLRRAHELLEGQSGNVSEIGYHFVDKSRYFSDVVLSSFSDHDIF